MMFRINQKASIPDNLLTENTGVSGASKSEPQAMTSMTH